MWGFYCLYLISAVAVHFISTLLTLKQCFSLPFCLSVTLPLATFKTQTIWSHFVHLGNHPQSGCFSSFSITRHCGVLGVTVGSFVLQCFLSVSVSLNCLLCSPLWGFTGEKHMLTAPSCHLSMLFISKGLEADENKPSKHAHPLYKLQLSASSNATFCSVLLRGGN